MKQKKEIAVLIVLLVIAGNIWYWFFFRENSVAPIQISGESRVPLLGVENPAPVTDPMDRARKTEYSSSGRNIFSRELPPPPPPPPQKVPKPGDKNYVPPPPPPPPPPPTVAPLPVKYFGYGTVPNGTSRRAFFSDTEDNIYIVSEGELLLNRFRILKIGNSNLEYEEIASGLHGMVPLEEEAPAPPLSASTQ